MKKCIQKGSVLKIIPLALGFLCGNSVYVNAYYLQPDEDTKYEVWSNFDSETQILFFDALPQKYRLDAFSVLGRSRYRVFDKLSEEDRLPAFYLLPDYDKVHVFNLLSEEELIDVWNNREGLGNRVKRACLRAMPYQLKKKVVSEMSIDEQNELHSALPYDA